MRTTLVAMVLVGLVAQQSGRAAQRTGRFMAYGPTTQSCGSWLTAAGEDRQVLEWWVLGFVSGVDWRRVTHLQVTDAKGIVVWVDKYCEKHPLEPIVGAAIELAIELGADTAQP
jgi:ABC-type cobalamin transport system permease subunit